MKLLFLIVGSSLLMTSCAQKKEHKQPENYHINGDTLILSANSTLKKVLQISTVKERSYIPELSSAGNVMTIPNFFAAIAPPFSGRVTKVHLRLGMKVNPGTPLFEMVSKEFMDSQKDFFTAKTELNKAKLSWQRQNDLKKHHVGSEKDAEESENAYLIALKTYESSRAALKIYQVDPDQLSFGAALTVRSPIHGEVITNQIVSGQYLKSDDAPAVTIAELSKVWVAGHVKEKDIRFIHPGDQTEIDVVAYPGHKISGKVYHIEDQIDEDTRSIKVLIECDNRDRALKPGMYATVNFIAPPQQVLFVPASAVLQKAANSFVFVAIAANRFIRQSVETGPDQRGEVMIKSGLKPGMQVVSHGSFYLLDPK